MEGPEGDGGAPDSWELADLEETVSRLLVSSSPPRTKTPAAESPAAAVPIPDPSPTSQEAALDQVDQFLREALEKPRERLAILRMEQEIEKFLSNPTQQQLELQPLPNSYLRLAAHRIAQHYSLQSVAMPDSSSLDVSASRIFLRKTASPRPTPAIRLADVPVNLPKDEGCGGMANVAIKRRPHKYPQAAGFMGAHSSSGGNQLKSVEERKEEYNRARARIFSGDVASSDSVFPQQHAEKPPREFNEPSHGGEDGFERDPGSGLHRYKLFNRVAIFRDRELDRRDPDYDRNYDRYAQRFDPGFGFGGGGGGGYGVQPLYSPAVNYNTEFPQLGARQQALSPHVRGTWAAARTPSTGYNPAEALLPSFGGNPALYPPYLLQPRGPRTNAGFVHRPDRPHSFSHQQQRPDSNFGLPRPR